MPPEFTPGPWKTIPCPSCVDRPCGKLMIEGPHNTDGRFDIADAHLISAAPDLYTACVMFVHAPNDPDAVAAARAALAKAEGRDAI